MGTGNIDSRFQESRRRHNPGLKSKNQRTMKAKTKNKAKSTAMSQTFAPGEHIRVVPLHNPKPVVPIDDLGRLRGEEEEGDLFDGKPHAAAPSAHLSYGGGPLLANVAVF